MNKFQTILFLVRHGDTNHHYADNAAIDGERLLNDRGRGELTKVGEYLKSFGPAAIYSSPIKRCVESAEIINEQLREKRRIWLKGELHEIYSTESANGLVTRTSTVINEIVNDHAGQQVVVVTHQFIIRAIIAEHWGKLDPYDLPCASADVYRLVFAGNKLVEYTRLQPARS